MIDIRLYRSSDYDAVREVFSHEQDDFAQSNIMPGSGPYRGD